jgi:hypothetical protein
MANSTGEREERSRIYKKTRVIRSSNIEEKEESEESEKARQLEVEREGSGRTLASDSAGVALVMGPTL